MSTDLRVLVVFAVLVPCFWLAFRHRERRRVTSFADLAARMGLHVVTDAAARRERFAAMPPLRLFATGTNQRFVGQAAGVRDRVAFELFDFHSGSQAGNSSTDMLVLLTRIDADAHEFSIAPTSTVGRDGDAHVLDGFDVRSRVDGVPAPDFVAVFGALAEQGDRPRVEVLAGYLAYWVPRTRQLTPESLQRVIDGGVRLAATVQ